MKNITRMIAVVMLLALVTVAFAAKPTIENIAFRDGHSEFPVVGKGTIVMKDGKIFEGEFKQGMLIKKFKWQFYDKKGKLIQIKPADVQSIKFVWDPEIKKALQGPEIEINIDLGVGGKVEPKNIEAQIKQFSDFDQAKYYEPIIMETINDKFMLQVNNGFDSKIKVYVPMGAVNEEYGYEMGIQEMIWQMILGGGEVGKKYEKLWVKKGDEVVFVKKPGIINKLLFGAFSKKEFVQLFGDCDKFMEMYPKPMKRKYQYMPEYVWVYEQLQGK